jgi:very-short-patch-repair endonuclease
LNFVTDRKTLQLRDPSEADDAPAIKKRGRGWEISEKRLNALHERARDMRRHPSDAHKALAARFAAEDFGKYKFTRHTVVGSAILDFVSHPLGLAVALEEEGAGDIERRRDKSLAAVGIEVLRLPAAKVLDDIEEAMGDIFEAMNQRLRDKQAARRAHDAANPRQSRPRYDREGNGPPRSGLRGRS